MNCSQLALFDSTLVDKDAVIERLEAKIVELTS